MNKQKEISATEKLLDFIRTQPDSPEQQEIAAPSPQSLPVELEQDQVLIMDVAVADNTIEPSTTVHESSQKAAFPPAEPKTEVKEDFKAVEAPKKTAQKSIQPSPTPTKPTAIALPPKKKSILNFKQNLFSRVKIGIDIQKNCINLAKIEKTGSQKKLLSCLSIPFMVENDEVVIKDQIFKGILSQALASFCLPHKKPEIWCSFANSKTSSHNVVIPKLDENELANAIFWSVKKETDFSEKTSKFDFSILKEISKTDQPKILALATLTPRAEISTLQSLFNGMGYPLTGIASQATAIHNLLQQDHSPDKATASIHLTMGQESTALDLFFQDKILFSREIKTGVESFVESVMDQAQGLGVAIDEVNAKNYVFCPTAPQRQSAEEDPHNIILDDLPITELKVIERLIRQLSRTFEYCTTHFDIPRVAELYTSGETVLNDQILQQIETKLDIKCSRLDHSRSLITLPDKDEHAPKPEHLIALGLALSKKSKTNNSIFTYADRADYNTAAKVNQIISIATIALALTLGAVFAYQYHDLQGEKHSYATLSAELKNRYIVDPRTKTTSYALNTIQKIAVAQKTSREKVIRFQTIAILSSLSSKVPSEIKLTGLILTKGKKTSSKGNKNSKRSSKEQIKLQGFVNSAITSQEFILLQFLKQLSRLHFAESPSLLSSSQTVYNGKEILNFKINLPIQLVK